MGRHEAPGQGSPEQPFRPAFEIDTAPAEPTEVQPVPETLPQLEEAPVPLNRQMRLDEVVELNSEAVLADNAQMEEWFGINARLMAIVQAGGKEFFVADVSEDSGFEADVVVLDSTFDRSGETNHGFKSIWPDQSVDFGREFLRNRFDPTDTMSRDHFAVGLYEGRLFVQNREPKNGTTLTWYGREQQAPTDIPPIYPTQADYTSVAQDALYGVGFERRFDESAPYGYYLDRPLLGRNSPRIEGGIYAVGSREAVIVDGDSEELQSLYSALFAKYSKLREVTADYTSDVLKDIQELVQYTLKYDKEQTLAVMDKSEKNAPVNLSTFVDNGVGVCRHQGLLAAYLMERLIEDGILKGQAGVERNIIPDLQGGHAWAVLRQGEKTIVVDPAMNFIGTKDEARRLGHWEYALDTDLPYAKTA